MAGQILGDAVDAEVGAQFQRPAEQRRGEGVVDHQRGAGFAGDFGDAVDLSHAQQRIGNGLHQDAAGLGFGDRGAQRVQIADIDEAHRDAHGFEHVHQQADGGAVERRWPPPPICAGRSAR